jgi:antitoxin component of MazEF toxin-antitoxin module
MVKHLKKVGNSNAITLDKALMELVGLEEGSAVKISVRDGSILLTPVNPKPVDPKRFEACLDRVVRERRKVLQRLAQ